MSGKSAQMSYYGFMGRDVLTILPTGARKSLIFQSFPIVFDVMHSSQSPSICLVISPLSSLMQDQVMYLNSVGIKAAFIGDDQTDEEIKWNVETGYYQLVYGSPEAFLASSRWRKMLTGDVYRDIVCLVAVDEAHCIQHWGYAVKKGEQAFRKWFSRINEMRSLLKKIPILALTATATLATKNKIVRALEMDTCEVINQSPNRKNIAYSVQAVTGGAHQTFGPIIKELREKTVSFERIIIYSQTIKICSHIYGVFKEEMGEDMYVSTGDITSGMVEMYHSRIDELNRDNIVKDFSIPNGHIRVLIATIAYGMGINCQGVKSIVHYGPSRNVEAYLQESGRAGRDSSDMCKAVILYSNVMLKYCDEPKTEHARNSTVCRRTMLLSYFQSELYDIEKPLLLHECCDICQRHCHCDGTVCSAVSI